MKTSFTNSKFENEPNKDYEPEFDKVKKVGNKREIYLTEFFGF